MKVSAQLEKAIRWGGIGTVITILVIILSKTYRILIAVTLQGILMADPTVETILETIAEYRIIGTTEFVQRYAWGIRPQQYYVKYEDALYPMRSLWAASCRPRITSSTPHSKILRGFRSLRFEVFDIGFIPGKATNPSGYKINYEPGELLKKGVDLVQENAAVEEGLAYAAEARIIMRNPRIVEKAKLRSKFVCEACGFDFVKTYGEIGKGYIEAHHTDELSLRGGENAITKVSDLTMLCSNCHRMIHRRKPCYSVDELIAIMNKVQGWIL